MLQSISVPGEDIQNLLKQAAKGGAAGHRALGRLIRLVDDGDPLSDSIDEAVMSSAFKAMRIGLTGAPGVGKSSLIASALGILAEEGKKIGVLAVDPTSPFTGGALLGDRIRLKGPTGDNVFFRSLASRGYIGGVSRAIWPAARLLDWWGADLILIETVGSGQLGTAVADVADLVVDVLTPEAGDWVQSMKAGITELTDCFIVNKSDRPGAELVLRELQRMQGEAEEIGRTFIFFETSVMNGRGVREAIDGIAGLWRSLRDTGEIDRRRAHHVRRELACRTESHIRDRIAARLGGSDEYERVVGEWAGKILSGDTTPARAAEKLTGIFESFSNPENP